LRAVRFSFFRSSLSSIFVVSATRYLFSLKTVQGFPQISRSPAYLPTGNEVYVNREFTRGQNGLHIALRRSSAFSNGVPSVSKVQSSMGLKTGPLLGSSPLIALDEFRTTRTNHRVDRSS
jgi:hypothetical protein